MASRPWLLDVTASSYWLADRTATRRVLPLLERSPLSSDEAVVAERVRSRLDHELALDPDDPLLLLDEEEVVELEGWRAATREVRQAFDRAIATSRTVRDGERPNDTAPSDGSG